MMPQDTRVQVPRRTKIVATLGPASSELSTITELIRAGVNVFRLNMSHGTHEEHRLRYDRIRAAASAEGASIAVLADLCGPKIRVGLFEGDGAHLLVGSTVVITTEDVLGNSRRFTSQYSALPKDVEPGSRILLDDGNIELVVENTTSVEVSARVLRGGLLKNKKGMNLPGVNVSTPALTEKDRADALFAASLGVDLIALSFVRSHHDLAGLRALLGQANSNPWIVAKIEKPEAVAGIAAILSHCDAIMVARGDLGVELPLEQVPNVQEELVDLARASKKPVIIATQMLESMLQSSRPTRAEVTDVANAVRSGADAVMLSAETAAGPYPVEAVMTMGLIIDRTESYLAQHGAFGNFDAYTPTDTPTKDSSTEDAVHRVSTAVASMSRSGSSEGIIALGGRTSLMQALSSQRPAAIIHVPGSDPRLASLGCLAWGVRPVASLEGDTDDPAQAVRTLKSRLVPVDASGFWLVVTSTDDKTASISVVSA